jgi:hypothetical protein
MTSFSARQIGLAFCLLPFAAVGRAEDPERVTTCQLAKEPAVYNHKLIEVTGLVSHGFEDFTLFDPECSSPLHVWLEYGGRVRSGTVYCCPENSGKRSRRKPLVVEGIPAPLVRDEPLREFDRLIGLGPDRLVRATIIGRFFAGEQGRLPNGGLLPGYGHLGCCSLLAIQQVLSVDPQNRTDLDYRASLDQPDPERIKVGCGYRDLAPRESAAGLIAAQQQAESGASEWMFNDPLRVATTALAKLLNVEPATVAGLRQTRVSQGRILYEWEPRTKGKWYMVVVSRPYWLFFCARDPQRVAWEAIAVYDISCE